MSFRSPWTCAAHKLMEKFREPLGETSGTAPSDPRLATYRSYAGRDDELIADDGASGPIGVL